MPEAYRSIIDVIRVCSLWGILLGHVALLFGPRFPQASPAWYLCQSLRNASGTIVFFGLASYHLCRTLLAGEDAGSALSRRLRRVYPPFLLMLIIYLLLMTAVPSANKMPEGGAAKATYVLTNVLLLPSLVPHLPAVLAISWAIGCVVYSYLVIAILYSGMGMRRWPCGARVATWILTAAGLQWLSTMDGQVSLAKISGFAFGALAAELPFPAGIRRAEWKSGSQVVLARLAATAWSRLEAALLNAPTVRRAGRFLAAHGYHALLCQGLALHTIGRFYPFGTQPGVADWAAIVGIASALSFAGGILLRSVEQSLLHQAAGLWMRFRQDAAPRSSREPVSV